MADILVADRIIVTSDLGNCEIHLCVGDIIKLPIKDKVDVLVISAFPGDYVPTPPSMIGQLFGRLSIDVRALAKDKEEDLRSIYSCWWSKPLPNHLSFGKILCFEGGFKVGKTSPQMVGDVFRCLVAAIGDQEARVMMPLLASGGQKFSKKQILEELVATAIHWIEAGLPLRCLKIVLLETDPENTALMLRFKTMKESYCAGKMEKQEEHSSEYDIYLSYCEEDKERTELIIECLKKKNASISVFSKLQELDMYESWQEQLYSTITSCKRVIALITPAYLRSTSCSEQYNIALCLSRKLQHNFLIPFYLSDVSYMPTYMEITQYIDCRIYDEEKITEACGTVIGRLVSFNVEEEIVKKLALLEPHYDVFLSYSHFNEDFAKKVIKELRIYQPDLNIFIDTAELKAGGAWQQALYEAIDRSQLMIALISGHYLRSKVCIEELSLGIALQCKGSAKLWPILIEPLSENVPWLKLISPTQCFEQESQQECSSLSSLCKNILKDIHESNFSVVVEKEITLTRTLEEFRKHILLCKSVFISSTSKGIMLSQESETPQFFSQKRTPNHVDIFVICSEEDAKYCHVFCQLLISRNPSLIIKKSLEETNSSRLSCLEKSSLVISLLSPHFISSAELIHELNVAWFRQRYAEEFCFLVIILDSIPVKPTYVHLLPCFFNCKDKRWNDVLDLKEDPSTLGSTYDVPPEVIRCFLSAIKFAHSWITSNECSVWGLHNKLSNCLHLANCLEQLTTT